MNNKRYAMKLALPFLITSIVLGACEDKMSEHYEPAEWLRGSAWEVLHNEGNYETFLKAVEISGFGPYVRGKGITTILAPNDSAFTSYLSNHGYNCIDDMPQREVSKLVGYHLLYYSYSKSMMENFRPQGQGDSDIESQLDPGLYYKFRTRSSSPLSQVEILDGNEQKTINIYHLEQLVPVFSHYYFKSKGIDAQRNYEYFYPETKWEGDKGFNIANAVVTDYAIPTDNGYLYKIDRVLHPEGTLYNALSENADYSIFASLYDRFSSYEYDATLSENYSESTGCDSLYLHKHQSPMAPIALEWPVSNYQRLDTLAFKAYSLFAPDNEAILNFYDSYWKGYGYDSVENVDPLVIEKFLREFCYLNSAVFPDEIVSGNIKNSFGLPYNFDPYQLSTKKMCSNGAFYGIHDIESPLIFSSVVGASLRHKEFLYFLYAMDKSDLLNPLASQKLKYTLLVPHNKAFNASEIVLNEYLTGNILQRINVDGMPESVGGEELKEIVNAHYAPQEWNLTDLNGEVVIPIATSYNYWFVKGGTLAYSGAFNKLLETRKGKYNPFVSIKEVTFDQQGWNNGKVYTYDSEESNGLILSEAQTTLQSKLATCNDETFAYAGFSTLLQMAGMRSGEYIKVLNNPNDRELVAIGNRFILFCPTNSAIEEAINGGELVKHGFDGLMIDGVLLGDVTNQRKLQQYLSRYFINASLLSTVPYPGSTMKSGNYVSFDGQMLSYTDDGSGRLSIGFSESKKKSYVVGDYYGFPFSFNDGCMHMINSILK